MWKDFLYFSRTERRGVIILVVLILGIGVTGWWLSPSTEEEVSAEKRRFEVEHKSFSASLRNVKKNTPKYRFGTRYARERREVRLTRFDPNTADSLTFLDLGLPSWMARNILRYRAKGGTFRKPEEFRKVYGLTDAQYTSLLPYIHLSEESLRREPETPHLYADSKVLRDTIYKYPVGTIVDLNKADTTELKKIPGIGSYIARSIVGYRTKLGGAFYQIEQLQEIHLSVDLLRPWFLVREVEINRINLNKSGLEKLMRHPYINFYQAKVILEYRKKNGSLKSIKQLALYEEFTAEDIERLSHYICCD